MPVIIQAILAAVSAAPQIEEIAASAKKTFAAMFSAGLISVDVQNALSAKVDAELALFATNKALPPEFLPVQ